MSLYTYECINKECSTFGHMQETVVPFENRDEQVCELCCHLLRRAPIERTGQPKWRCKVDTASGGKPTIEETGK